MKGRSRNLGSIDLDTGEILDGTNTYCPKKHKSIFSNEGYISMSQAAAEMIANSNLSGVTLRVLWMLIAKLDMENYLYINQSEIAEKMGLNKPHISRAIKDLIKEGIILEGLRVGKYKTYRLDPHYGWKGSTKNHVVALEDHVRKKITRKSAASKNISIVPDKQV